MSGQAWGFMEVQAQAVSGAMDESLMVSIAVGGGISCFLKEVLDVVVDGAGGDGILDAIASQVLGPDDGGI